MEVTVQDDGIDHSADGAAYKGKVAKNLSDKIFQLFFFQTDEVVTLNITIDAGLPVHYEIFWGDLSNNEIHDQNGNN